MRELKEFSFIYETMNLKELLSDESSIRTLENTTHSSGDVYVALSSASHPNQNLPLVKIGWGKEGRQRIQKWRKDYPLTWQTIKDVLVVNKIDARKTESVIHSVFASDRLSGEDICDFTGMENPDGKTEWFVVSPRMNELFVENFEINLYDEHKLLNGIPLDPFETPFIKRVCSEDREPITLEEVNQNYDLLMSAIPDSYLTREATECLDYWINFQIQQVIVPNNWIEDLVWFFNEKSKNIYFTNGNHTYQISISKISSEGVSRCYIYRDGEMRTSVDWDTSKDIFYQAVEFQEELKSKMEEVISYRSIEDIQTLYEGWDYSPEVKMDFQDVLDQVREAPSVPTQMPENKSELQLRWNKLKDFWWNLLKVVSN